MRWMPKILGLGIMTSFFFVGCTSATSSSPGTISPSLNCQRQYNQQKLAQVLANDSIQVVQVGENVTLMLLADKFFLGSSNHMRQDAAPHLNDTINFINAYPVEAIQVTGYTDDTGDDLRNIALSRAQAQAIANYLVTNGLNARLVSANGKGGCQETIANNRHYLGRVANRRIEIFFRMPPPDNVFH